MSAKADRIIKDSHIVRDLFYGDGYECKKVSKYTYQNYLLDNKMNEKVLDDAIGTKGIKLMMYGMNKTKLSWSMANIEKMHSEKKVLSFEHPIQRKSEQWNNNQKSLLIHSMLANYPVPYVYVLREDSQELDEKKKPIFNYFVMDGKQRLTSVLSYIWGEFPLDESIPNIFIEDVEYEIAGKYFCDL